MKRPLAAIGLTYMATSAVAVCFFPEVNFILCVMAVITAITACLLCREKMRNILLIGGPICLALLIIGCCQISAGSLSDKLNGQSCVISGEICEIPRRQYGRWRYIIETDRIDIPGAKQNIRILMTSAKAIEESKEGDRITCEVQFLQSGSSEVGYSSATSLRADGIKARCWFKPYSEYQVDIGGFNLRYLPQTIKRAVISAIKKALPKRAAAMLCGMLLGDTGAMDKETVENFRSTGIAHLLAVSGLHVTLLTLALREFLRRLRISPAPSSWILIGFIFLFMSVTGFSPSVVRAGTMHILALIGKMILRDADSLTSLSASVLLMCLLNPWAAADIGLQLSVCATLGLLLAAEKTDKAIMRRAGKILNRAGMMPKNKRVRRLGKNVVHLFANTVTASLAILPLTAIHFERLPLISPVTNILCVYFASGFLIIGISAAAIYCIPLAGWLISLPLRFAAGVICLYLEAVTGALAKLPFSTLNTSYSYTPYFFLSAGALIVCAFIMMRFTRSETFGKRLRRFVLCEIALLLFAATLSHQLFCKGAEIIVFDTGSGGVCVCAKNRTHAFFAEAGGNDYVTSVIRSSLRSEGVVKVDGIAVSEDSTERSGNIYRMIGQYSPDWFISDMELHRKSSRSSTKDVAVLPFGEGLKNDSPELRLETFTDSQGGRWERLTGGETTALICPEKGNCLLIPEEWRSCDAAVVGREINGAASLNVGAIITTANEKYADRLCNRLQSIGFRHVYSTSRSGNIILSVRNGKLRIQTDEG